GAPAREPAGPVPGPAPPRTGADRAGRAVSACRDCSPAVLTGTTAAATATAAARAAGTRCPGTAAARVVARCSHAYSAVLPPTVLLPGSGRRRGCLPLLSDDAVGNRRHRGPARCRPGADRSTYLQKIS